MQDFIKSRSGAVTTDFVMLTAAIIILGTAVISVVRPSLNDSANRIASEIDQR